MLHGDVAIAKKLNADGVHLRSDQYGLIKTAKKVGLLVTCSTHTKKELLGVQSLGADMATISPVFHSPGKGEALGLEKANMLAQSATIPVLALGGIVSEKQISILESANFGGFAAIRYFFSQI